MTNNSSVATSTRPGQLPLGPRRAQPVPQRLSGARMTVLRTLAAAEDSVTVTVLAKQLSQHPNTVREHLDALLEEGRVERTRSTPKGRGRPSWRYRAMESMDPSDFDNAAGGDLAPGQEYASLAVALIDQVANESDDPAELSKRAGERWGHGLAQQHIDGTPDAAATRSQVRREAIDATIETLDNMRFSPEKSAENGTYRLTTCPLLDAARRNPEVVCQVHLGVIRGILEELGTDPDITTLEAFAEPGACLLKFSDRP